MSNFHAHTSVASDIDHETPLGGHDGHTGAHDLVNSLGKPREKQYIKIFDLVIVLVTWACLAIAVIFITPRLHLAWQVQQRRQLQIIGLMISTMSQCVQVLAPNLWIMLEACFKRPKLQNFDAILRNSVMVSHTHPLWRVLLLAFILLPIGLGAPYKQFTNGFSERKIDLPANMKYGLTAPAGLMRPEIFKFGPAYMVNATLPFLLASIEKQTSTPPQSPDFSKPVSYGFNLLTLNNHSTAFLDTPMPLNVSHLQGTLNNDTGNYLTLTANVHATVATYNDSIESGGSNDAFWNEYDINISNPQQVLDDNILAQGDLRSNFTLGILYRSRVPWIFLSFLPTNATADTGSWLNDSVLSTWVPAFRANALLFNMERRACTGTWQITYNSIDLVGGSCDAAVPDQGFFITNDFGFNDYYMPNLAEFLAPMGPAPGDPGVYAPKNPWLMSTFATVVAGMYWSRGTAYRSFDNFQDYHNDAEKSELLYSVLDPVPSLSSIRQTMKPSALLYFVLAVQPVLITLIVLASFIMSFISRLDGANFNIIAVLAGVRTETLRLFEGASFSGTLRKAVEMRIVSPNTEDESKTKEKSKPQIEFIFHDDETDPQEPWHGLLRRRFTPGRFEMKQGAQYYPLDG